MSLESVPLVCVCACVRVCVSNYMSMDMSNEMGLLVTGPWGPGLICTRGLGSVCVSMDPRSLTQMNTEVSVT